MAKRFTDTEKFIDPWYRRLSTKNKLLWDWLLCNCDIAGIITVDFEFIEMVLNEEFEDDVIETFFSDRLFLLGPARYFIPKFIRFQYVKLNKDSRVHKAVISKLAEYAIDPDTLSIGCPYSTNSTKDKDKDKEKDKAKDKDKDSLKEKEDKKNLPEFAPQDFRNSKDPKFTPDHFVDLWNEYFGERLKRTSGIGCGKHRDNFLSSLEFLPTEKHWRDLFDLCINTPKVMGQNDIGWTVSPTWIVDYDNAIKVLNGDFDDAKHIKNLFASMNSGEAV